MTLNEVLTTLIALLAVIVSLVSLYRTRRISELQLEKQNTQISLERESAKLAKLQREQLELSGGAPRWAVTVHPDTIFYEDDSLSDTVVELLLENDSSLNRSLNKCVVGLLEKPTDAAFAVGRYAQHRDTQATYPISLAPHSSIILYSFGRHIEEVYHQHFGTSSVKEKQVAVHLEWAGLSEPVFSVVATFRPGKGFSKFPLPKSQVLPA